ncbi:DUF4270 family protein [Seonamhaeicola sp. NFXS20]|uniref:DUF4270 family protein n=1 Tax=unclassified Seonamhaeicola TaxID=2622645 RepID=UPI0035675AA2
MKIFFIGTIIMVFMFSCSDDIKSYPVGSDFIDNDVNLKVLDTFTINAGTFKLDSIITSSTSRILLGSVKDDYFGNLTAQSYFQVVNSDFSISSDAVYDSIGLVLNYDNYYYGDTTRVQTYKVHRLQEYFEPQDDGDEFYNVSKLEYDEEPLGEFTFSPRPTSTSDSIYIPLDKDLGEEIFNKIRDNDINNSDDFLQYFYGLTVIPDTLVDSNVLGFTYTSSSDIDNNSGMRIFYTEDYDDTSEDNDQVINFYIPSSDKHFNAINSNLSGTVIENLDDQETTIDSYDTDQLIFSQGGIGVSARIEMPTLKYLKTLSDESTSLSAELTFAPLLNSYDETRPLQDSLAVYIVDNKNRIVSQLTDVDANTSYAILNQDNDEFNESTYYSIDMSGFVNTIFNSETDLNYAIMIQFIDYNKTVDSVIIDDLDEDKNNIKLSVTYLEY